MSEQQRPSVIVEDMPSPANGGPAGQAPRPGRKWIWLVVVAVAALAAYRFWPKGGAPETSATAPAASAHGRGGPGVTPVVAVKATRGDIGVYITDPGSIVPVYTVTVASLISGYLMKVLYTEGQTVHQGDPLAEIDPRPYQVQLEQAQGNLAKDEANLNNAKVDLVRYQTLVSHNAVPEQTLATQQALVKQDEGIVVSDQAQIDNAKLDLTYCHITAPINGRVGLRLIDPGNYVQPSSALVVITQLHPITAVFPIAEDQLPEVLKQMRAGSRMRVDALDRNMKQLASGWLTTLDNQIDPTTGTVKLRATFDNSEGMLFPNQFINARLLVEEKHSVTLVATAAIQRNSQNTYVWLVNPNSTVTVRHITVGTTEGNESEVSSGLSPGEEVVMTGVDRLQEGSKVRATLETSGAEAGAR